MIPFLPEWLKAKTEEILKQKCKNMVLMRKTTRRQCLPHKGKSTRDLLMVSTRPLVLREDDYFLETMGEMPQTKMAAALLTRTDLLNFYLFITLMAQLTNLLKETKIDKASI